MISVPRIRVRLRVLIPALVLGVATAAAGYLLTEKTKLPPLTTIGPTQRERQLAALRLYVERGEQGSLVPKTDALIAIREQFLRRAINRSLPFRQYFEDGRYVARIDSADVRLEPGLAKVTLMGRGMQAGQEDSPFFAELFVAGFLNVTGIDPDRGTLEAALMFTDVHARRAGPQDMQALLNPVARYFGRLKAADWNRKRQQVHLPLRIDREIVLPELDGDVSLAESRIPLAVQVSAVTTLPGHMAVSLALAPDSSEADSLPRATTAAKADLTVGPPSPPWYLRLARRGPTAAEGESLRIKVARMALRDPLWRGVVATDHDIVAIVPGPVLGALVSRASRRYLIGADLDIRPAKLVQLDKTVRVKVLGTKTGVGRIKGTILISHLRGRLTVAGEPRVAFEPPNDLVVTAPLRVLAGHGAVAMDVEWDPTFMVSLVCHGFRIREKLAGEILPFGDSLTLRIRCSVRDSNIVGRMRVQRDVIHFSADLTDSSWSRVLALLVDQDRITRCGLVMNPDSLLTTLQGMARQGIAIRLPERLFKPFRFPVVLESEYMAGDYRIEAHAFDPAIAVNADYLRLAFRTDLRVSSAAPVASRPDSAVPYVRGKREPAR